MMFAGLCWSLWTTRNKFTIEHVFPRKPTDLLFKLATVLQLWRPLTKEEDHLVYDGFITVILHTASSLLRDGSPSNPEPP